MSDQVATNQAHGQASRDLDLSEAYDYELPEELVAAHPATRRAESRLLVVQRQKAASDLSFAHQKFSDLLEYLRPEDLLVFNNTRVLPARVMTRKSTGGKVELLVLDVLTEGAAASANTSIAARWGEPAAGGKLSFRCMTRSSRALRPGMALKPEQPGAPDFVVREYDAGTAVVDVNWHSSASELLQKAGQMPLPPYIVKRRKSMGEERAEEQIEDRSRYQTIYASKPGAIAAPTAGLHFSDELFDKLEEKGVRRAFVTLQVGVGTFQPISTERLSAHQMHSEEYEISAELADAVARCRARGGRVIAVGTTSARALEAEARRDTPFEPGARSTDIFLYPGQPFKLVDGLITNFHLPRSTLLALVAAFIGFDAMRELYKVAVAQKYRFYSYGDATLLL